MFTKRYIAFSDWHLANVMKVDITEVTCPWYCNLGMLSFLTQLRKKARRKIRSMKEANNHNKYTEIDNATSDCSRELRGDVQHLSRSRLSIEAKMGCRNAEMASENDIGTP